MHKFYQGGQIRTDGRRVYAHLSVWYLAACCHLIPARRDGATCDPGYWTGDIAIGSADPNGED